MKLEDKLQRAIVDYLELVLPQPHLIFAIPNAAARRNGGRAGNAVPGLRPGMPDLAFIVDGRTHYIEVKRPKHGKISIEQTSTGILIAQCGANTVFVTTIEGVRVALRDWGIRTKETIRERVIA